jgi:hypothetical protein
VISEIDIWRVANLMLKRYGYEAEAEGARRADDRAIRHGLFQCSDVYYEEVPWRS